MGPRGTSAACQCGLTSSSGELLQDRARQADEWLELYRTQHLPVLKQRQREGHIYQIIVYRPFLHQGQPVWDFKVILTYRDFATLGDRGHFDAIERRLYPDWDAHQRAERHRWEITVKHWDDLMLAVPAD